MFKIGAIVLGLLLLASVSYAATVPDMISSNTISYNTVAKVVTFNTVCQYVSVTNLDDVDVLYTVFGGNTIGWNIDETSYTLPAGRGVSGVRVGVSSTVTINIATDKLGFVALGGEGTVTYFATSSSGVQP